MSVGYKLDAIAQGIGVHCGEPLLIVRDVASRLRASFRRKGLNLSPSR
jgi:hypothetical protein